MQINVFDILKIWDRKTESFRQTIWGAYRILNFHYLGNEIVVTDKDTIVRLYDIHTLAHVKIVVDFTSNIL